MDPLSHKADHPGGESSTKTKAHPQGCPRVRSRVRFYPCQHMMIPSCGGFWKTNPERFHQCNCSKVLPDEKTSKRKDILPYRCRSSKEYKIQKRETSLAVQWLRLHTSNAGVWVQSLVGELRSHMLWPKIIKLNTDVTSQCEVDVRACRTLWAFPEWALAWGRAAGDQRHREDGWGRQRRRRRRLLTATVKPHGGWSYLMRKTERWLHQLLNPWLETG